MLVTFIFKKYSLKIELRQTTKIQFYQTYFVVGNIYDQYGLEPETQPLDFQFFERENKLYWALAFITTSGFLSKIASSWETAFQHRQLILESKEMDTVQKI